MLDHIKGLVKGKFTTCHTAHWHNSSQVDCNFVIKAVKQINTNSMLVAFSCEVLVEIVSWHHNLGTLFGFVEEFFIEAI